MVKSVGEINFEAKTEADVSNNSIFLDSVGSEISYKDDGGASITLKDVPIGAILPWVKTLTGLALPGTFLECDGTNIVDADSPMNGQALPNLSGNNYHLRGNSTSGGTGGGTSHGHSLSTSGRGRGMIGDAATFVTSTSTGGASSLPSYYDVVWVMKIK